MELAGCYRDALKALEFLQQNRVDLIFLDINMPDLTGIQFLKSLTRQPLIIFTTAYSKYDVESYDYADVDYLLKPIEFERFLKAVNRAHQQFKTTKSSSSQEKKEFIMVKYSLPIVCIVTLLISTNTWSADTVSGYYFGQEPPGLEPTLFAPGIISLPNISEIRVAFSPDGNECFFTKSSPGNTYPWHLYYTQCIDNEWTPTELAPFHPQQGDFTGQPFFSASGHI